jgi:hypothetical protein
MTMLEPVRHPDRDRAKEWQAAQVARVLARL